jgi:hypothetical protein
VLSFTAEERAQYGRATVYLTPRLLQDVWAVSSLELGTKLLCTMAYRFLCDPKSHLSGINKCLKVHWQGQRRNVGLVFKKVPICFLELAMPFYNPTDSV